MEDRVFLPPEKAAAKGAGEMKAGERLKRFFWPTTRCVLCGGGSDRRHPGLCAECYGEILARRERLCFCGRCGRFYPGTFRECPHCYMEPRRFPKNGLFAAVPYEDAAAALVKKVKYGGRRDLVFAMARLFFRLSEIDGDFDVVTAVPLHGKKQKQRGFNQSEDLARAIAEGMDLPFERLLRRVVDTPSQTTLPYRQRLVNVKGAFVVPEPAKAAGRRILIVDDVVTTGATSLECVRALKEAGAERAAVGAFAAGRSQV